jgi:YVTN family beta-propeller protein
VYAQPAVSGEPYGVSISSAGIVLVARVLDGSVTRFDPLDTLPINSLAAGLQPVHLAFAPGGERAYVVNQAGQGVRRISLNPFAVTDTIPLSNDGFNLAVAPNGGRVYVTTANGRVYVVLAATLTVVDSLQVGSAANGLAFNPGADRLYISSRDAGTVTVFDTRSDAALDTIVTGGAPQRLAVSADGLTLFVANESSGINVIALPTGTRQPDVPLVASAYGLGLSPDGQQLYATDPTSGVVYIVDVRSRTVVHSLVVGGAPRNVAFDHDGTTAVVTDGNGRVLFIQ